MYISYAYLFIYMERKRESPRHGSENSHCLNNMNIITIPVNVSTGTEEILQVLPGRRTMSQWLLRDGSSGWGQKKKRWIIKVRAKLKHRDNSVLVPATHAHVSATNLQTHRTRGNYDVFLVLVPEATTNIFCSSGSSEMSLPFKPILKVNKIKLLPKEGGMKDFINHKFSKVKIPL